MLKRFQSRVAYDRLPALLLLAQFTLRRYGDLSYGYAARCEEAYRALPLKLLLMIGAPPRGDSPNNQRVRYGGAEPPPHIKRSCDER